MGQYFILVNTSKRQLIRPHAFGDGAKLLELASGGLTLTALAVLLADGNGRGGGDVRSNDPIVGSWAGDRIVVSGDYADPDRHGIPTATAEKPSRNLFKVALDEWEDVSEKVLSAMWEDEFLRERIQEGLSEGSSADRERLARVGSATTDGKNEAEVATKRRDRV